MPDCGRSPSARRYSVLSPAHLADRSELRRKRRKLALHSSDLLLVLRLGARFFGAFQRFARLRFVKVGTANRGVRQHRDEMRLNLENAAGDENELLFAPA